MAVPSLLTIAVILAGIWLLNFIFPINLWITAQFTGVKINLFDLVFMRFRKVPPGLIVRSMIIAHKAGIEHISTNQMETHYLANGNLEAVIKALIVADKANLDLTFKQATAIDLAGRNVLEAVQVSVTPYVVIVPAITGVSVDGIQLVAVARVTVRSNIQRLVGGAGEETIKARVGQGIISRIGTARHYAEVLESPESISKQVLANGLDSGTAFDILSIDIADLDVGENIGAALQIDQAAADLNIAKAKAEEKRAMAVALEQEMVARTQEAKAKVIQAEAEIPAALSAAFRVGQLYGKRNSE
ncbi:flotillin-like protein FloA [Fulvivirga sedimenti]|uniref:Flotillin-like protein FloA n=1 Tax=Fulvivirga sedimenti TaxID=2879465 RepID=A0A9X1KVW5_9BACT|nr:flotillin-like protein FloA [Fulvivirga sedimenti]MCA6075273.1 flotillin-like protein FloA [Fulvivirga sedimenti]MCA6076450.1 flotillin-like protein FloA [Fulvivirga sedimenti]MCA6077578.1 flotillin-like protein FloA [Fulvivirga sedimenti]